MTERFFWDEDSLNLMNVFCDALDFYERSVISIEEIDEYINEHCKSVKNKAFSIAFFITHFTFFKLNKKDKWDIYEILDIIKANPKLLDIKKYMMNLKDERNN